MQTHPRGSFISHPIVAALSSLLAFHANGVPQTDTWYIGAQAGWVFASKACEIHSLDCDDNTAGGALFIGYVFNDWLAFEAGYDYLGKINATYPALNYLARTADYESETQGLELVAKPYWSIDDNWSLYGKAGTLFWHTELTGHEVDFTHNASDSDWSPLLGGGVEYAFNRNWSSTLEYRWINNVGGSDTGGGGHEHARSGGNISLCV